MRATPGRQQPQPRPQKEQESASRRESELYVRVAFLAARQADGEIAREQDVRRRERVCERQGSGVC